MDENPVIWALIDERPGTGNQCRAVANSIGLPFIEKHLNWSTFANMPNFFIGASLRGLTTISKSRIKSPWPDLVISSGRRAAGAARFIKRKSHGDCGLVHIMYPGSGATEDFDIIAVPNHDGDLKNSGNVIRITGAPHGIDAGALSQARVRWNAKFSKFKKPITALVVGGSTKRHPFTNKMAKELGRQTADFVLKAGSSLLVTTSPRTGNSFDFVLEGLFEKNIEPAFVYRWKADGLPGDNPYLGFLANADQLIVTGESTTMCSEACAIGNPVHIFAPEGFLGEKHKRLVDELVSVGYARLLDSAAGEMAELRAPKKLDVAGQISKEIRKRILSNVDTRLYCA
jgi:mitochondrial fission protein ELM1